MGGRRSAPAPGPCCVVAPQQPFQPGRADFARPSDDELRCVRDVAVREPLIATIIGELSDGAIALIDLRADESVLAAWITSLNDTAERDDVVGVCMSGRMLVADLVCLQSVSNLT